MTEFWHAIEYFFESLWRPFGFRPIVLWCDGAAFVLLASAVALLCLAHRREYWRAAFRQIAANRLAMICFGILCLYCLVGFLDTLHFVREDKEGQRDGSVQSVLDLVCAPLLERTEKTYSVPLAICQLTKETVTTPDGLKLRGIRASGMQGRL